MKNRINQNGFNMIEVVAILLIMAVVAVSAVSHMNSNEYNLINATDTLISHLRIAQSRAMNMSTDTDSVWGVRFVSTTQYHLFYCANASTCDPANSANQKTFFGADNIVMDISGKRVQITNGAGIIAFDRFGTPYTNVTLTTALTPQLTLTLQNSDGITRTINITPQTGMII